MFDYERLQKPNPISLVVADCKNSILSPYAVNPNPDKPIRTAKMRYWANQTKVLGVLRACPPRRVQIHGVSPRIGVAYWESLQ